MQLIFPLITFPYSSRILMPEGLGKIQFAAAVATYFSLLANLGFTNYAIREAAKIRDDKKALSKFAKEIFILNMISAFIAYILLAIALMSIPKLQDYKSLIIIYSAMILFNVIGIDWLFYAIEEFSFITIRSLVFQIISLILLFTLVKTKDDYLEYAAIAVFANVGSNFFNFLYSRKFINWLFKVKLSLKKHIKPVMILFGLVLVTQVSRIIDTTVIGFLSTNDNVGYYAAAIKIVRIVINLVSAMLTVLLPRLTYYIKHNKQQEFTNVITTSCKYLLFFSIPACVGLFLLCKPIILLFSGSQYLPAINAMKILSPTIIFTSITSLIGIQLFIPLGKETLTLKTVLVGSILNFTLTVLLVPHLAVNGATIATLFSEFLVASIEMYLARKYIPYKKLIKLLLQSCIASAIMGYIIFELAKYISNIIILICCSIPVGMVVYGVVLFCLKNEIVFDLLQKVQSKIYKN